jgi:sulfonate transport system substrate-binding protein
MMINSMSPVRPRHRRRLAVVALAVTTLALAACGSSAASNSANTTAAGATVSAASTSAGIDLSGVTLRFGDTSDNHVKLVFDGSGESKDLPYKVQWSQFQAGPALIAAETGGSVDLGKMSETPLVFAQGAGSPVKAVWAAKPIDPTTSSLGILVKNSSSIKTLADLKGKKVAYSPGTVLEYLLADALASVNLTTADITPVTVQAGVDLLATGGADAIVTGTSQLSTDLLSGQDRQVASGAAFTPGFYYLVASESALKNPATTAAINDFDHRLAAAEKWYNANVDTAAGLVEKENLVTAPVAKDLITRAPVAYGPIDAGIIAAQQKESDFFTSSGALKSKLNANDAFDQRFGS